MWFKNDKYVFLTYITSWKDASVRDFTVAFTPLDQYLQICGITNNLCMIMIFGIEKQQHKIWILFEAFL